MFSVGQIVFSKKGRDKGKPFIVISTDGEYVYLVDGSLRKIDKPKKKKSMHVQMTNDVSEIIVNKIGKNELLVDADVKKVLIQYNVPLMKKGGC